MKKSKSFGPSMREIIESMGGASIIEKETGLKRQKLASYMQTERIHSKEDFNKLQDLAEERIRFLVDFVKIKPEEFCEKRKRKTKLKGWEG